MNKDEQVIESMIENRNIFYNENVGDEDLTFVENAPFYNKLGLIDIDIIKNININKESLSIDFILESLSKLGWAPNIIYDDNGMWAVTDEGMQEIILDDENVEDDSNSEEQEFYFYVKRTNFKSTIKDALYYYLEEYIKDVTPNT